MPKVRVIFGKEKRCGSCKQLKKLVDFPKAKTLSGFYCYCKLCANLKNRKSYSKFSENVKKRMALYRRTETGKRVQAKATLKDKIKSPEKFKARHLVRLALRKGQLKKPDECEASNISSACFGRLEAHHPDYSKPLKVRWLCVKHHKELHYGKNKI
jgi:hypothetical protein